MTMPKDWNNNDKDNKENKNSTNNDIPPSRKQKKLLKQKMELEASLNAVRIKIQREEAGKQRQGKLKSLLEQQAWYELWVRDKWMQVQQEEQKQQDKYLKKYDPQNYKENRELQKVIAKEQYQERLRQEQQQKIPGEGKRQAGKALIVFGIFITVISILAGSFEGGILGFIINIIGIGLLVSGNKDQGRGTTIFGGGFVSTGD
jgi:hypothetical protein